MESGWPMFPLNFNGQVRNVEKIKPEEFSGSHRETLRGAWLERLELHVPDQRWSTAFLGAGEEKAVFCVRDEKDRVFAVEAIGQGSYLNGRFVGGHYFPELDAPRLRNIKAYPESLLGLVFSGKMKPREFVHGYEWGRFQFSPRQSGWVDNLLTNWLQTLLSSQFQEFFSRYKDVHDRNVMFEVRPFGERGVPVLAKDWTGKLGVFKVGLQAIDVR